MKTRAAVLDTPGTPMEVVDLEVLPPGPGEVRVRLGASGLCRSDYTYVRNASAQISTTLL